MPLKRAKKGEKQLLTVVSEKRPLYLEGTKNQKEVPVKTQGTR